MDSMENCPSNQNGEKGSENGEGRWGKTGRQWCDHGEAGMTMERRV